MQQRAAPHGAGPPQAPQQAPLPGRAKMPFSTARPRRKRRPLFWRQGIPQSVSQEKLSGVRIISVISLRFL